MPEAFFWLFSSAALLSSLGVVFSREALHSACWMFAVLLALSGVMAWLGAWFLALVTMLVYAGAILVLFTFVIMFLGQRAPQKQIGRWRLLAASLAVVVVAAFICLQGVAQPEFFGAQNSLTRTAEYGAELFGRFCLPTQLAGWVLLWVMVGSFNTSASRREGL